MSNIGYSSSDWGMAGYYAQEDATQKWEEYQEYLYDRERKNYETNKERVLQFAAETAKAYQDESNGEEYSTETWRGQRLLKQPRRRLNEEAAKPADYCLSQQSAGNPKHHESARKQL